MKKARCDFSGPFSFYSSGTQNGIYFFVGDGCAVGFIVDGQQVNSIGNQLDACDGPCATPLARVLGFYPYPHFVTGLSE